VLFAELRQLSSRLLGDELNFVCVVDATNQCDGSADSLFGALHAREAVRGLREVLARSTAPEDRASSWQYSNDRSID